MWKKDDETPQPSPPTREPTPSTGSRNAGGNRGGAVIGPSITIKGEVTGEEDLLIQGRVDGSVELDDHAVTVGPDGRVKADLRGRVVTVEGEVEGDLEAEDQVILRSSARVQGDITAPRVVLEDGARFRGLVDMGEAADRSKNARGTSDKGARTSSSSSASTSSGGASSASGTGGSESKSDTGTKGETNKTEKVRATS